MEAKLIKKYENEFGNIPFANMKREKRVNTLYDQHN